MAILAIVICFKHSKWMPINADHVWPPQVMQDHFSPSLCTITKRKATEFLGNIVSSASWPWLAAVLAWQLCEFHTKQWGEPCSVPVGCLPHAFLQLIVCKSKQWGEPCSVPVSCSPHAFLQLIVCKSAVNCLKSLRAVLLSQDRWWEGTFAHTHTLFLACTYRIWLLCWLNSCVNFITEQWEEPFSVPVGSLPHALLQLIICKSAVDCLKSQRVALILQDRQQEDAFTCTLLPSDIAIGFVPYSTTWPWRIIFLCWRVQ